jgi:hypothetical protein
MQIGWATSRCRFSPEEGYGVGDDCVSQLNKQTNKSVCIDMSTDSLIIRMDSHSIPIEQLYGQMVQLFIHKVK